MIGESPTRPGRLLVIPPVEVAAARFPSPSSATAPTVPCAAGTRSETRSEEHTSELQSHSDLVCRLLLEKKKNQSSSNCCSKIPRTRRPPEGGRSKS